MLSPRLLAVADFVPQNAILADIGTDHASLPISLVRNGTIKKAIAVDVHKGPYEIARRAVNNYNITDKIEVRLGDGLMALAPGEANAAVFAGMGGLLINSLLAAAPHIAAKMSCLILQPQLAADKVRRFLYEKGWHIENEALAAEPHHLYQIIYAVPGRKVMPSELELLLGPILLSKKPKFFNRHAEKLLRSAVKKMNGLKLSNELQNKDKIAELDSLIEKLEMVKDG